ncbi:MAG TPA: glycosyltransferase [Bryobacteraceae bacterium]|nr:glycosyltransferase [Bryobacteraceae bacterium]
MRPSAVIGAAVAEFEWLRPPGSAQAPAVSIVTTVYDRVECLRRCIESVRRQRFTSYEQIVVADRPPDAVLSEIATAAEAGGAALAALKTRRNDWGISPAAVGLSLARGKYVCFLSDDNGFLPDHLGPLVAALEEDPELGFAYSSCLYAGRRELRHSAPEPGQIDLGQPLFRRELFGRHLGGAIPFREFGWDWRMISALMKAGVRWKHIDNPTFVFRLDQYAPTEAPAPRSSAPPSLYAPPRDALLPRDLPRDLAGFRGFHAGQTLLVCGCGSSLAEVEAPERFVTVGVNDVGRLFQPDYLVVVNPRSQFSGDRFQFVENSRASAVFTHLDLGISHPNIVRFRLGRRGGTDWSDPAALPYTRNSPYVALCLALQMGARRIGLIGVDFTEHHFFGPTGRHSLAGEVAQINREYEALALACRQMGVEVCNLSAESRLTAFPKISPHDFARTSLVPARAAGAVRGAKTFFVNYRFLSCGEVFTDGLNHAARDLGVQSESAYWDDPNLPARMEAFAPDLLFVVHGRKYSQRYRKRAAQSAVWLLDEPYEVDDTSRFSQQFETVFVNDPGTLHRHPNAHFLPVCYDPETYSYHPGPRPRGVGFIGGGNPARESMLGELARRGLLSYAVGGPWRDAAIQRVCLSGNIPAADTAELYRQTQIVINVFRTQHHFNRERIPAVSMNPRVYEALACGALVISERRPEIEQWCPEMPLFDGPRELVSLVESLLSNPARWESVRKACIRRLAGHTYAHRLHAVLAASLSRAPEPPWIAYSAVGIPVAAPLLTPAAAPVVAAVPVPTPVPAPPAARARVEPAPLPPAPALLEIIPGWEGDSRSVRLEEDGAIAIHNSRAAMLGGETGLSSREFHFEVRLSFEVFLEPGAVFLAKVRLQDPRNPKSNSYHLVVNGAVAYVARHNKVLLRVPAPEAGWQPIALICQGGAVAVETGGKVQGAVADDVLESGFCFLGVQTGSARVRHIAVRHPQSEESAAIRAALPPAGAANGAMAPRPAPSLALPRPLAPQSTGPKPCPEPLPFTAPPLRNLIYHIWPVRGQVWQWNIQQLKARIDLFNGRRVIGIVHDARSEDPSAVQAALEGHGCEFVVLPNQPSGEVATFPVMLRRVASTDLNEVTFYGHGKGVKHEPSVSDAVRRWAEMSYRAGLDDWRQVRSQLERFALTGAFRMYGRFRSHRHTGDWHYSGTYYWMRHARVFARDCFSVPPFYCGVEAWPGKHFARHESGCLLFDDLRQLAYDERFWEARQAEIALWEAEHAQLHPPPGANEPVAFEGCDWPRIAHRPDEFAWLLDKLSGPPRSVLALGASQAAAAWHLARRFRNQEQDVKITAVAPGAEAHAVLEDARRFGQKMRLVPGDPSSAGAQAQVEAHYDAVLIDGEPGYRGARGLFDFALSRGPRLVALHGIADSDWHAQTHCCVSRLWNEVRGNCKSESLASGEWGGIGILHLDEANQG